MRLRRGWGVWGLGRGGRGRGRWCPRAAHDLGGVLAGLPELHVKPLGHADARALLVSVLPGRLDEHVLDRILIETRGNPLALLELPSGLTPAQLAGGFGMPPASRLSA